MVICIQMCLRDAQVARCIGTFLHSLDERDIFLESLGCPLQLCCIHVKCSSMLTRIFCVIIMFDVRFNNNNNAHCVLVFGCVAMCSGWSWQAWGFHSSFAVKTTQAQVHDSGFPVFHSSFSVKSVAAILPVHDLMLCS